MKKVSIFGRSVPLFAVLIVGLLVTGVSAAVVNYLSNTVTADGNVESPYDLKIRMPITGLEGSVEYWDETGWSDTVEFGTLYGGETLTIEYKLVNRANVGVIGDVQMEVMCSNGIDADNPDFENVLLRCMAPPEYVDSPIAFRVEQGSDDCHVLYTTDSDHIFNDAGDTTYGKIEFVVKENAVGTYTISGKLIPVADAVTL